MAKQTRSTGLGASRMTGERKNRLPAPVGQVGAESKAAGEQPKDALQRWKDAQKRFLERAHEAADNDDASRAKSYAIAAGIATEKTLLLENKPSVIIGGLQENRHLLPDVLAKLAAAAEVLKSNG